MASHDYSDRVPLKTIFSREDRGIGLVGERMVIGGWVSSSKELHLPNRPIPNPTPPPNDLTCSEILQSGIPFLRTICKIFGKTNEEKVEIVVKAPPPAAVLHVGDGSCVPFLQVLVEPSLVPLNHVMAVGTCIVVKGVVQKISQPGKYEIQLEAEKILHIGLVDVDKYPLTKKRLPLESLRDCPHLRQRTRTVAGTMRIRSALMAAANTFLQNHGFLCVHIPIITATDTEPGSEKFQVATQLNRDGRKIAKAQNSIEGVSLENLRSAINEKSSLIELLKRSDSNNEALAAARHDLKKTNLLISQADAKETSDVDYFSNQAFLTASGHLHLESYACALGNVYSFGPRFRAHKSGSAKQVAEMWMLEVEMAFTTLEGVMNCACDLLKFLSVWVTENCTEDMKFLSKRANKSSINHLQSMTTASFQKIPYAEAIENLSKVTKEFGSKTEWGSALTEEQVIYLADEIYKKPIIIYDYPKEVKPFHMRLNEDGITVATFDVIVPKAGTLVWGGQNEERIDILEKRMREMGMEKEETEWYLDLRRHGSAKHSGLTLPFDQIILATTGMLDVREVIPFPRASGRILN